MLHCWAVTRSPVLQDTTTAETLHFISWAHKEKASLGQISGRYRWGAWPSPKSPQSSCFTPHAGFKQVAAGSPALNLLCWCHVPHVLVLKESMREPRAVSGIPSVRQHSPCVICSSSPCIFRKAPGLDKAELVLELQPNQRSDAPVLCCWTFAESALVSEGKRPALSEPLCQFTGEMLVGTDSGGGGQNLCCLSCWANPAFSIWCVINPQPYFSAFKLTLKRLRFFPLKRFKKACHNKAENSHTQTNSVSWCSFCSQTLHRISVDFS